MIPRNVYDSELELFRDSVSKFLIKNAQPYHEQWEKDGQVSRELWLQAGEQGFLAPTVPEVYGGVGADFRYNAIVDEEVARLGLSGIGWGLHSDIAVPYIVRIGSEEQKKRYLPAMVSGEIITAIAMTEPATGSDLQGIKTTAALDGNEYVINGSKTFITNGQMADLVIVVAKTDISAGSKGISLFLVEADSAGFSRGKNLKKIGMKAQDTSELFFDNLRVPKSSRLGEEGMGFLYLMQELPQERLSVALYAITSAASILQQTVDYVKQRQAFGHTVATFQNTQFKLADAATEIATTQVFVDRCLELHIDGKLDAVAAAQAKLVATEVQNKVIDECLQLHGGYGYMWEYSVARAWADARVQKIYAGTSEIMKLIIGRDLLKE